MVWEKMARIFEQNYGGHVNWEERFFICPECGEPIYEEDWDNFDLIDGDDNFICPICESIIN